jgi:hypothetical protein
LIASGGAAGLQASGAFSTADVFRPSDLVSSDDNDALLGLDGFDSSQVYQEPHQVTVTNLTESTLTSNEAKSAADDLKFRDKGASGSSSGSYSFGTTLAPGESYTFEVVTSGDETGKVSDMITLSLSGSDGVSVETERSITVQFNAGGQLVYAINGDLRIYDAVNDVENDPPNSADADIIGANAANIVAGSDADVPYLTKGGKNSSKVFATWVGATNDEKIDKGKKPKLKKQKTRLALRPWPYGSTDGDGDLVLAVDNNTSKIIGVASNGDTETIASPPNGAGGVAGVKDIDGDGNVELVFVDSSQQMRYLEGGGATFKIPNAGVGSNNSTGFGSPVDFGRGKIEIPFIDGSNNPAIVDYQGTKTILNSSGIAKKAAIAPVDIDGDGAFEFMFLGNSSGNIKYIDDVGGSNTVKTLQINGSPVSPDEKTGLNSGT